MQLGWCSLEQSKKLIEAGLEPDTADMYYYYKDSVPQITDKQINNSRFYTPCWSLGRLIKLMPKENQSNTFEIAPSDVIENGYAVIIHTEKYYMPFNEQALIDAVVNAVTWLLENNYINKGE